jgi:hypothetical protein
MANLQTFYIPPAGIHPSIIKHNYDLEACSGVLGEGCEGVEGSETVAQCEVTYRLGEHHKSNILV